MKRRVSHTIPGPPVPSWGSSILDDTLIRMLDPAVVGASEHVVITTPAESHYLLDFTGCPGSLRVEDLPLLVRLPKTQHVFLAVGVSTETGRQVHVNGKTNGDHFVAMYVDISTRRVHIMDSLPTLKVTQYLNSCLPALATNIYGAHAPPMILVQTACRVQDQRSNDCAVWTWANIVLGLTKYQYVPALRGINVEPEDFSREVFRILFFMFYE